MNSIVVSAKTVEKAIEEGLVLLNTSIENVDVNIISEGGFFKKATVELTLSEEALQEKEAKLKKLDELEAKINSNNNKTVSENSVYEQDEVSEELQKIEEELELLTKSQKTEEEVKELTVEEQINKFMNGLIYAFNINATTKVEKTEEDEYLVEIVGENLGVFIGYRGETLDAIQFLLNNYIYNKTGYNKLILLDIENYRAKRVEVLKNMAINLSNKVLNSKKSYKLEPMNKYERKIIHSQLQDVEHIATRSEGKEPHRYLIISYTE